MIQRPRGKDSAVRIVILVGLSLMLLVNLGCAVGGGGSETEIESGKMEVTDEKGFEREMGPAEIAYQSAQQFLSAGNYEEAIRQLKHATIIKPSYLAAWSDLGKALTKIHNYEEGIAAFEKALELTPGDERLIASIGYNYLYLENWDKAEEYYNMLIEKDAKSYEGNVHLGFIYQSRGDIDRAIGFYELALESNAYDAVTMGTLATLYGKKDNTEKKIEYLKRAIEAAPDNYKFRTQLGKAYMDEKDYHNAVPVFEELVEKYPDMAAYHQNLGLALSQTDRKAEAPAELEKAIELKSNNSDPLIYVFLAQFYNELDQPDKALTTVNNGLKIGGQEAALYYQWGVALSKLKKYDDAIAKFQKVISLKDPQLVKYANQQIERQEKLKKRAEALKERDQWE